MPRGFMPPGRSAGTRLRCPNPNGDPLWNSESFYSEQVNLRPLVYGNIESTGINAEIDIRGDTLDKKTLLDVINQMKESVGYIFFIDHAGAARFHSSNVWRAGNFDDQGLPILVEYDEEGSWERTNDGSGVPFIPVIHESVDMHTYGVNLNHAALRSEIIIGSNAPDPKDPTRTGFIRFIPPNSVAEIRPGVPASRNIDRPMMWVNTNFSNEIEQKIMAELINLQIWFSLRTGAVTCTGNPNLNIDDQVRLIERNTSETYIHYIRGINSSIDLRTGVYTMNLTTNWLGNANDWVITTDGTYQANRQIQISELVDKWQSQLRRGRDAFGAVGTVDTLLEGGFNAIG